MIDGKIEGLDSIAKALKEYPKEAKQAFGRAARRIAPSVAKSAQEAISEEYNVTKTMVRKAQEKQIIKTDVYGASLTFPYKSQRPHLLAFKGATKSPGKRKNTKIRTMIKAGSKKTVSTNPKAFLFLSGGVYLPARRNGKKSDVFAKYKFKNKFKSGIRESKKRKTDAFDVLRTLTVTQMVQKKVINDEEVSVRLTQIFEKRFYHELDFALQLKAKKNNSTTRT